MDEISKELLLISLERKMYQCLAEINIEEDNPMALRYVMLGYEKLLNKMGDKNAER